MPLGPQQPLLLHLTAIASLSAAIAGMISCQPEEQFFLGWGASIACRMLGGGMITTKAHPVWLICNGMRLSDDIRSVGVVLTML